MLNKWTIPTNCTSWYDGCNTCNVKDGKIGYKCTRRFCYTKDEPKCKGYASTPALMALEQMQQEELQLQMLTQELAFHGVELQNLGDLSEIIALQNLEASCLSAEKLIKLSNQLRTKVTYDAQHAPIICWGYFLLNPDAKS